MYIILHYILYLHNRNNDLTDILTTLMDKYKKTKRKYKHTCYKPVPIGTCLYLYILYTILYGYLLKCDKCELYNRQYNKK